MEYKMKNKKSEASIWGLRIVVALAVIMIIAFILLGLTGRLGEIGQSIWKGIKNVLPFV